MRPKVSFRSLGHGLLYVTMCIFFMKFYFIDQFLIFLEGKTTYYQRDVSQENFRKEPRVILLCNNYVKEEEIYKYGLHRVSLNKFEGYETVPELPDKSKYDVYTDFRFRIAYEVHFLIMHNGKLIEIDYGDNLFGGVNIQLTDLVTVTTVGYCFKLSSNQSVDEQPQLLDEVAIAVADIQNRSIHMEHWHLFLSGENNWYGIVDSRYTMNDYFETNLRTYPNRITYLDINLSPTIVKNMNGIEGENLDKCYIDHLQKANCSTICLPIVFNFLKEHIPFCYTNEEYLCMLEHYHQNGMPCFGQKAKRVTKFQGQNLLSEGLVTMENMYMIWLRIHQLKDLTILEEVYIMTEIDFIGSVGGSLGLFLGFSFFSYASFVLDQVFNRFSQ